MQADMQSICVVSEYEEKVEKKNYKLLKKEFGKHKKLAHGYGLQALLALRNYPKLKDVEIDFSFTHGGNLMTARPCIYTVFNQPDERKYQILINTEAAKPINEVLMRKLSFDVQVGQLAHEVAHVYDYLHKNALEIIGIGVGYFSDKLKANLESRVDCIAIGHGYGYQLIDFAHVIEQKAEKYPDVKYYTEYFDYYMTAEEIKELMKELPIYQKGR